MNRNRKIILKGILVLIASLLFSLVQSSGHVYADDPAPIITTACGILNQAGATYILQNDVFSDGTCFGVQANNITLDLGRHKVTYGNAPLIAISNGSFEGGVADWDLGQAPNASVQAGTFVEPVTLWDGSYALRFALPASPQNIVSSAVTLPAGRTFAVSAMVNSDVNDNITMVLQVLDAATQAVLSETTRGRTWGRFEFTKAEIKLSQTTAVVVKISIEGAGLSSSGALYVDDIRVQPISDHGVVARMCGTPRVYENPCGGTASGFVIKNGTIEQGTASALYGDAISLGQINASNNIEITDIVTRVHGPSSINIKSQYLSNLNIHHNTFFNDVTTVTNRHQVEGTSVKIEYGDNHIVNNNTISGGAQGGIQISGGPGSRIYGNDISQNGRYTNDFSIYAWSPGIEVYDNYVHPQSGRGISVIKYDSQVHDNTVEVRELRQNQEYNGCQIGGAYGIQLEEDTWSGPNYNNNIYSNTVTAYADQCDGRALRVTSLDADGTSYVRDNILRAVRVGNSSAVAAAYYPGYNDNGILIENNTLIADSSHVYLYWNGSLNTLLQSNAFSLGANPSASYRTFFLNTSAPVNFTVRDGDFQAGTGSENAYLHTIQAPNWGPVEYYIEWTLTVNIQGESGQPLDGSNIEIFNTDTQQIVFTSPISGSSVDMPLSEKKIYNTQQQAFNVDVLKYYSVTVSKEGFESETVDVVMDSAQEITFTLIPANSNQPPELAPIGNKTINEGDAFSFIVTATDSDLDDTVDLFATNLPSGSTFIDNGNRTGTFNWTPTTSQAGTYANVHFEVTDGTVTDSEDITITVLDGLASCTTNWTCTDWSVCSEELQTRICTDLNSCGTDTGRPSQSQACDSVAPEGINDLATE